MLNRPRLKTGLLLGALALAALPVLLWRANAKDEKTSITILGSDTMVNLAQAWAEEYGRINPAVSISVSGGGSGTGIAGLINGTLDLANSSRKIEPEEAKKAKENTGKDPVEFMVGYDALSVFVAKNNPLSEIAIEQLAEIYGENPKITKWSQLGLKVAGCDGDEIVVVSRQNNSGTYHYFREAILGKKRDYRLGTRDMNGSKDVVALVEQTPCAIGYSGMAYATPGVKALKVAKKAGQPAFLPSIETTLDNTYPIARPLYMYSLGKAEGGVKKYLDWILSDAGQKVVKDNGYVPLPKK